jgi:hypothetical protein
MTRETLSEQLLKFEHWALQGEDDRGLQHTWQDGCPVCRFRSDHAGWTPVSGMQDHINYHSVVDWPADLASRVRVDGTGHIYYTVRTGESWCWTLGRWRRLCVHSNGARNWL